MHDTQSKMQGEFGGRRGRGGGGRRGFRGQGHSSMGRKICDINPLHWQREPYDLTSDTRRAASRQLGSKIGPAIDLALPGSLTRYISPRLLCM